MFLTVEKCSPVNCYAIVTESPPTSLFLPLFLSLPSLTPPIALPLFFFTASSVLAGIMSYPYFIYLTNLKIAYC